MRTISLVTMWNSLFFLFTFGVFSLNAEALTMDDLKQKYVDNILECSKQYPVDRADAEQLQNRIMPDKESVRCLFACVYKLAGMMNDQGELSVEGVNAISRKYLAEDPEKLKKSEQFTEACRSVNDAPVNDGTRGCDRAALIFQCTIDKSPDFNFV
uniref:SFRICE009059.2 n=1 Tax=Spodoptera frugiperda TaxID=7108 RepID=A0A2H1X070_SPOFR